MAKVKQPIILSRFVREEVNTEDKPVLLETYRDSRAWVLLAEPGAGKSTALAHEASLSGGVYLSITEFISDEIEPSWKNKTLFLDGLDEIRASSRNNDIPIISKIRSRLKSLGNPRFRLSCRAADWHGVSDTQVLQAASSSKVITVLQLEPLNSNDIHTLLQHNYAVADPEKFTETANRYGVDELLNNPQMLELLVAAISGGVWPSSRDKVYQLACAEMVDESSRKHRNILRENHSNYRSSTARLDAAGQLCAVLLLSDQYGFALDVDRKNSYFMLVEQCDPPDLIAVNQVIGSQLFRPYGEERLVPCHRSVAEYLAAKWLAKQLDNSCLPRNRLFNLLLGVDDRAVASLRGLYGWLALHCHSARQLLIKADVMAVVIYGDPKPMSSNDKRQILQQLQYEAENASDFNVSYFGRHAFTYLLDPALEDDFRRILTSNDRSRAALLHLDCVVDMFWYGEPLMNLIPLFYPLIIDEGYCSGIRETALKIWLQYEQKLQPKITLLNNIKSAVVRDNNDEFLGILLTHLYPSNLSTREVVSYLHSTRETNIIGGSYEQFLSEDIVKLTASNNLPALLDEVCAPALLKEWEYCSILFWKSLQKLLNKSSVMFDDTKDQRLLNWLAIRVSGNRELGWAGEPEFEVAAWFEKHPARYKSILALCYQDIKKVNNHREDSRQRLSGLPMPADLGLWHSQQAQESDHIDITKAHLSAAIELLIYQPENAQGLCLNTINTWANTNNEVKIWLETLLVCPYPTWYAEDAEKKKNYNVHRINKRTTHSQEIQPELAQIAMGVAEPKTLYLVAGVYKNYFNDIVGNTAKERFNDFVNNGSEVFAATEAGLKLCPERNDIPRVAEILSLYTTNTQSHLNIPCLVGMAMRYEESQDSILSLPKENIQSIIAFYLVSPSIEASNWITLVALNRPDWVAQVYALYISTALKIQHTSVSGIHELYTQPEYKAVAKIVVPKILKKFPLRANASLLTSLKLLLIVGVRYCANDMLDLLEPKLLKKSMGVRQNIYWLAVGLVLDSKTYEQRLWRYIDVGDSQQKIFTLSEFITNSYREVIEDLEVSVYSLGRLIELLAPDADMSRRIGVVRVTDSHRRGDGVRCFIGRLQASNTADAIQEVERLLALTTIRAVHSRLESAHNALLNRQREEQFIFLPVSAVANVINNNAPVNAADLLALASDVLIDIAVDIRNENDNGYNEFWNIENRKPLSQRVEDQCRESLLRRLRQKLHRHKIDCQPESYVANGKRSDIRLSYQNEFELPIEIKRDSNVGLWTSIQLQLVEKYTLTPKCEGHGVYLVLWFGNDAENKVSMKGSDGDSMPKSAGELRQRLTATIKPYLKQKIIVHVIDVSLPETKKP